MLNLFVIIVVLALAYVGVTKNFFSSLLHMACVVVAGAIAFAAWEPVSYLILEKAPARGFLEPLEYSAWAFGLVIPFAVSLAILRVATDKLAPANAVAMPAADVVGGAACGLITGVITAGILVIAAGTMRFKSDWAGYQPVQYSGASLSREGGLLLPVDRIVGGLYAHTSEHAFSTGTPLARWRPEPWHAAEVMRLSDRGLARNTARPSDYELQARYRVEAAPGEQLLQDTWTNRPHAATMLDGSPYPPDSRIEAVILELKSGLREPGSSQVTLTEGQVWMVAENEQTGERLTLHPVAVVANPKGADTSLARFMFDSPNFVVASPGAATRPMAFEFVVPNAFDPIAVYLKNVRRELKPSQPVEEFTSVRARDVAITQGSLIAGAEPIPADYGEQDGDRQDRNQGRDVPEARQKGIVISDRLPGRRMTIQKGTEKGMRINSDNEILEGEDKWTPQALETRIVEESLRIEEFYTDQNVAMVQVNVYGDFPGSMFGQAMAAAERLGQPLLVDTNGITYEAVGWVYRDRDMVYIRYTPSQPIRAMTQLADNGIVLSSSREDQELTLLFLVSTGAQIKSYNVGQREIVTLDEPVLVEKRRR